MSDYKELQPEQGWLTMPAPRIRPPGRREQGLAFRTIAKLGRFLGRDEVPQVFTVFHIHARLFWAWLFFASRLMPYGRLPARLRELIVLRTAWLCRSRYEWGQHVEVALSAGVTDEEIIQVSQGPEAFGHPADRAALLACDELKHDDHISDGTWQMLSEHYSDKLIIEIVILTGHYAMLAGLLNASGIALEPAIESVLSAFNSRLAAQEPTAGH